MLYNMSICVGERRSWGRLFVYVILRAQFTSVESVTRIRGEFDYFNTDYKHPQRATRAHQ